MNVVNLGECRDLLKGWDLVRAEILKGRVQGYALCIKDWAGQERIYFAGHYQQEGESAAAAALRMSWELTKESDFQAAGL
jgi:hypothetical protein